MAGKAPRQKGNRFERELVNELRLAGIGAYRIPLSGSMRGYKGDVAIRHPGGEKQIECKSRRSGFSLLYQAIEPAYAVAVRADRCEPLIVLRLTDFAALVTGNSGLQRRPAAPSSSKVHEEKLGALLINQEQDIQGREINSFLREVTADN